MPHAGLMFSLALASLTCGACSTLSSISTEDDHAPSIAAPRSYDPVEDAKSLSAPLISSGRTPGIIVGIETSDGRRHYYGAGSISRGGHLPQPDTPAAVGSLTKGWVGAVADMMATDGELHWDDTLGDALPDIRLSPDASRITLRELATHTSGLPRQPPTFETFRLFVQYLFTGEDFYRRLDRQAAYDYLGTWRKPKRNRARYRYSNVGYGILASVMERKAGKSIEALVRQRLLQPLGMHDSAFGPEHFSDDVRMEGHAGDQPKFIRRGRAVADWKMNHFMQGVGGGYSTARDLLQYASAHVVPSAVRPKLAGTVTYDGQHIAWQDDPLGEQDVYYQFGVNSGHTAFVGIDRCNKISVVVLQNSFNWSDEVGRKLMRRIAAAEGINRSNDTEICRKRRVSGPE